jgi:hypothetical protein
MIARPSMGDIRDVSFSRISIARAGLAAGLSRSNGPCPSHEAILTKLSPTRLRRRCLLVMHTACDYKMCSFSYERPDARPSLVAINVDGLEMERLHAQKNGRETLHLERVNKLLLRDSAPLPDQSVDQLNELAF